MVCCVLTSARAAPRRLHPAQHVAHQRSAEPLPAGARVDRQPLHIAGTGSPAADDVGVEAVTPAVDPEPHRGCGPQRVVKAALVEPPERVEGDGVDGEDPRPVEAPGPAQAMVDGGNPVEVVGEQFQLLLDIEAGLAEPGALPFRQARW